MDHSITIFLTTLALEDGAMALSVALIGKGQITFFEAFMACFLGISIGDIGLYFLGRAVNVIDFESQDIASSNASLKFSFRNWFKSRIKNRLRFLSKLKSYKPNQSTESYISYSVVLSRFVPGTRIPAYVGAGLLKYSFFKFFILTILSVAFWVLFILLGGKTLFIYFSGHLVYALIGFVLLLLFAKSLIPKLMNYWSRRAMVHSWRKWTSFEFWPPWLFYAPIVPIYIFRSLVGRSFTLPFYANPQILNSGLMGESKWDFLQHLDPSDKTTMRSMLLDESLTLEERNKVIVENGYELPFILKPDVGQRGYGVRIIKSKQELDEYLGFTQKMPLVLQDLSQMPREAGIFYYRKPSESQGHILSITDKKFPFVVADGKTMLGDLILQDKRARIIAPTYFARFEDLNKVFSKGEKILLSECGNHCQGAIFENGQSLITANLAQRIDQIAKTIPDFYFGRFDIRYKNHESLMQGQDFEIIEINGAGSEATHIWDKNTTLFEAYKVLWIQWKLLFEIGYEIKAEIKNKKRTTKNVKILRFLAEVLKVVVRKDKISISS
jgi:membrane protein DedA with SNARE-associated domain